MQTEGRLLSVDSRKVPLYRFDVLVIGSGSAGCAAAVAAADCGAEVAILAKSQLRETNSAYAKGGIAAVLHPTDSFEQHIADTLIVGCGLSEPAAVEQVVRGGPEALEWLIERGAQFDRSTSGELELQREGGHSRPRIAHAGGDATGFEIQRSISLALARHPHITCFESMFVIDVLCGSDGAVVGALVENAIGERSVFSAGQVILASGGAGQMYRETTNPTIATADGVAIGFRAGAQVRDIEFVQFHPTMLYIAGASRVLISEIVRGAGGVLRDRKGVRFMPEAHPEGDLAPRDVVSRVVFERMVAMGDTNVFLDLSMIKGDPHKLFPSVSRVCAFFGIDIARDPVPVRPGAHYQVGGLQVDGEGRTTVSGLLAAGECASSGLHGANRMGSNSLLECLVLGRRAGLTAANESMGRSMVDFEVRPPRDRMATPEGMQVNISDVTYSLKSLMWRQMGIQREGQMIADAGHSIDLWMRVISELAPQDRSSWELMNMLTVARLMSISAGLRTESRGVHFRMDHPELDPQWQQHLCLEPCFEEGRIVEVKLRREAVQSGVPLA